MIERRPKVTCSLVVLVVLLFGTGCTSFMRNKDQRENQGEKIELPETVGEATHPHGLQPFSVQGIGLVEGLNDTGSDPDVGAQRSALLAEMQRRQLPHPEAHLADPKTSLVEVRAILPPGLQKGDPLDVEVKVPRGSKTTSLDGGWLMETQLQEVAVMKRSQHYGHVRAIAKGPILINSLTRDGGDKIEQVRGMILAGGIATKDRPIGLKIRANHHSVTLSKLIGTVINYRFDTYVRGVKQGAAKPKTDEFIELMVHPRYRNNLIRYIRVIEQIRLRETPQQQHARLEKLGEELLVPSTSPLAALKLEAIGDAATDKLRQGLNSPTAEVQFYAAEALAYLDVREAAEVLGSTAFREPAFRQRALLALGAMSSTEAHDQLTELLHVSSVETRYGAFRALQQMNSRDPLLGQTLLDNRVYFHEIASTGEPMIHVSRTRRPEIVVFGTGQKIETPLVVFPSRHITVRGDKDKLTVTRYITGDRDEVRTCDANVRELITTLVDAGATYPEIVQSLRQAQEGHCLAARIEFDRLPVTGRTYERKQSDSDSMDEDSKEGESSDDVTSFDREAIDEEMIEEEELDP